MQSHLIRGDLLLNQERFELAIEEYRQALTGDPTNGFVHLRLATALLRSGRWNEALRSADVALEHEPNEPAVFFTRALIYLERSMLKEAEAAIRQAIELEPDDPDNHGLLARVLYERSRFQDALDATEQGLALDASNDFCLTYRARALSSLGRHEESHGISEELLREDPLDSWNHCLRGEELLAMGKPHEARVHFLESLRLSPGNPAAREGFAIALKARSPIFGAILNLCLWIQRFKARYIWGALIGLFVLMRIGGGIVEKHPEWGVAWEIFRAVFFGGFILLALANPMFDLILRFDPEGRHALSDDEKRATNWYLVCFGLAGLCGLWAAWSGNGLMPRQIGIAFFILCGAVYETFQATPGYVRKRMGWLTLILGVLLATLPVAGPLLLVLCLAWKFKLGALIALQYILWLPVAVMLVSMFADGIRGWLEQRRPD
jgi:tetratricopeptide (TPR) repeat protein